VLSTIWIVVPNTAIPPPLAVALSGPVAETLL
jgi:hypothetical protein